MSGLVTGAVSLTPIQHWLLNRQAPECWHFNQSILLEVPAGLNTEALRLAFAAVIAHHDALRSRFQLLSGGWQQAFAGMDAPIPFSIESLNSSYELTESTLRHQQSLNLEQGPVTRLVFIQLPGSARLFWCIHHLAVDGVSWRIVQEDLHSAYQQQLAGQAIRLPAKTSSFKAWAERLASYAHTETLQAQLPIWQSLPNLPLPVDNPSGANRLEHQQGITVNFSAEETAALLREAPAAYNTRINDVLLTALALALAQWTGNPRQLVALEGHGRVPLFEDIDLSRTVGWFTAIHPVLLSLPAHTDDLGEALKAIKEQLRLAPDQGIGYGLLTELVGHTLPKAGILFNYLGQFDQGVDIGSFRMANEATGSDISLIGPRDYLIEINGIVTQGQLSLNWTYSAECHQQSTIAELADSYQTQLRALIAHCRQGRQGATPSDFPLAAVQQATVDTLYRHYPGLQDVYPLSPMQQGMLFHALYEPETGVYFEQLQLTLSHLDPVAFKQAWQFLLERHPILRTAFVSDHEPMLQVVQAQAPLFWREHDWRGLSEETRQAQLNALLTQERAQGFDLGQAPLMRFDLIRIDGQRHEFIQHSHHVLMDGWCLPIVFAELRDSYVAFHRGQTPVLPAVRPFRDYLAWLQKQDKQAAKHYWQQRLAGFYAPTSLPVIAHKTETPDYQELSHTLDSSAAKRLQAFSQKQRVTLNTLAQAAWGLLLSRYSREEDVCFGVTVSGRNAPLTGIERMVGLFINTLPLRILIDPKQSVKAYLQQVQAGHQEDNRHAHSPLVEIQAASSVPNGTALFDSLLVFENYPLGDALDPARDCYQIERFEAIEYTNYPLMLAVMPGESLGACPT